MDFLFCFQKFATLPVADPGFSIGEHTDPRGGGGGGENLLFAKTA